MDEHDQLAEQAAPYALGALNPGERAEFEAHLATCAQCAAEVWAFSSVASDLAQTAPPAEPSPAVRARLMAAIAGGTKEQVVMTTQTRPPAAPPRTARGPWLAAAASALIAIALGAYTVQLRNRIVNLERAQDQAAVRYAYSLELASGAAREAASQAEEVAAVLAAPDLAQVLLAGQPAAPSASARAFWSRSRGLVFNAANMPALPAGRTYQLWVIPAQAPPISAGLIKPDASGRVTAVFKTPPDLPTPTAMAVTIEPDGGVPAPTGDKYLVGVAN